MSWLPLGHFSVCYESERTSLLTLITAVLYFHILSYFEERIVFLVFQMSLLPMPKVGVLPTTWLIILLFSFVDAFEFFLGVRVTDIT